MNEGLGIKVLGIVTLGSPSDRKQRHMAEVAKANSDYHIAVFLSGFPSSMKASLSLQFTMLKTSAV